MIEQARVLKLHLIVPTQDNGDEKFQKDQAYNEHVAYEKCECALFSAASDGLFPVAHVVYI
jgi:hypothetical protein